MKLHHAILPMLVLLPCISCNTLKIKKEERITIEEVPEVVMQGLRKEFPEGEILRIARTTFGNEVDYDFRVFDAGRNLEVEVESTGEIDEIEEPIHLEDLPDYVTKNIADRYEVYDLKKAKKIIEKGVLTYEVRLNVREKGQKFRYELGYDTSGKLVRMDVKT